MRGRTKFTVTSSFYVGFQEISERVTHLGVRKSKGKLKYNNGDSDVFI